jgi:hypothetical protein
MPIEAKFFEFSFILYGEQQELEPSLPSGVRGLKRPKCAPPRQIPASSQGIF